MASVRKLGSKTGVLSYQITVTTGRDMKGKQVRHFKTWRAEPGMTEKQAQKALQRAASDFEREIEMG